MLGLVFFLRCYAAKNAAKNKKIGKELFIIHFNSNLLSQTNIIVIWQSFFVT